MRRSRPSAITRSEEVIMQVGEPSHTARGAAAYRAIHQTLEGGVIFSDPFASKILDDETRAGLDETAAMRGAPCTTWNDPMRLSQWTSLPTAIGRVPAPCPIGFQGSNTTVARSFVLSHRPDLTSPSRGGCG